MSTTISFGGPYGWNKSIVIVHRSRMLAAENLLRRIKNKKAKQPTAVPSAGTRNARIQGHEAATSTKRDL